MAECVEQVGYIWWVGECLRLGLGLVGGRVCRTRWIYLVGGRMSVTGTRASRLQSV